MKIDAKSTKSADVINQRVNGSKKGIPNVEGGSNRTSYHSNNDDQVFELAKIANSNGGGNFQGLSNKQIDINTVQTETINNTGMPEKLKSGIETLSGFSMDDVKVHYNSDKPGKMQAHAFAQGTDIHLASGQEKHLPHEAWHLVQQKQGRVKTTMQMKGNVNVNDDAGLEKEADVMGVKALHSIDDQPDMRFRLKLQKKKEQSVSMQKSIKQFVLDPKKSTTEGYPYYDSFIMEDVRILEEIPRAPKITGNAPLTRTVEKLPPLQVIEDAAYFLKWVHIPEDDQSIPFESYLSTLASRPWKTWNNENWRKDDGSEPRGMSNVIPKSTARIPKILFSVTNVKNLPSISIEGFNTFYAGLGGLGSAHGEYKYAPRDMYLRAIWLGTSASIGMSMLGSFKESDMIEIVIKVPTFFQMAFFRTSSAVMEEDENSDSSTILSFESIPPEYLYINKKELGLIKLSEMKEIHSEYEKNRERDLTLIESFSKEPEKIEQQGRKISKKESSEKLSFSGLDLSKFMKNEKSGGGNSSDDNWD